VRDAGKHLFRFVFGSRPAKLRSTEEPAAPVLSKTPERATPNPRTSEPRAPLPSISDFDTSRWDAAAVEAVRERLETGAPLGLMFRKFGGVRFLQDTSDPSLAAESAEHLARTAPNGVVWIAVEDPRERLETLQGIPWVRFSDETWQDGVRKLLRISDAIYAEYSALAAGGQHELDLCLEEGKERCTLICIPANLALNRDDNIAPAYQHFTRALLAQELHVGGPYSDPQFLALKERLAALAALSESGQAPIDDAGRWQAAPLPLKPLLEWHLECGRRYANWQGEEEEQGSHIIASFWHFYRAALLCFRAMESSPREISGAYALRCLAQAYCEMAEFLMSGLTTAHSGVLRMNGPPALVREMLDAGKACFEKSGGDAEVLNQLPAFTYFEQISKAIAVGELQIAPDHWIRELPHLPIRAPREWVKM